MPSLRVVNVVLVGLSLLCVGIIVTQLARSGPTVDTRARPPGAGPAAPAPAAETPRLPAQAYNVIATRNLFSPTRTETPGPAAGGGAPISIAKPSLHGVVLREGSPIAYLEDPMTKRIAGYRIGDPIAGGTVQTISADAVVIARPDGSVDVRLRDPSKPRPAAPPAAGQPPTAGQPPVPGQPPVAGQPPSPGPQPVPGAVAPPTQTPRVFTPPPAQIVQPGQPMPGVPNTGPFSRPSPSLGRRLPPTPVDPANPQQVPPQN
jgi:hypothetical protein